MVKISPSYKSFLNFSPTVKKLIGEWIKLRFGVFSEEDSELFYYDPEQNEFSATYCANEVANGTLT